MLLPPTHSSLAAGLPSGSFGYWRVLGRMGGRGWSVIVGLSAAGLAAAGVAFYLGTTLRDAAPFGLALCAGIGLLSVAALRCRGLSRAAVVGSLLLAGMVALGVLPVVVGLSTGTAEPALAWNAVVGAGVAGASAASAIGIRAVSRTRLLGPAEPDSMLSRGMGRGSSAGRGIDGPPNHSPAPDQAGRQ
jgi:hypothetical protein